MRITQQALVSQALANVQTDYTQYGVLQTEADTGNQINNVSDNPTGAVQVMAAQALEGSLGAYQQNVNSATTTLNLSVSTLTSASDLLTQAKSLAEQGVNTTNDQPTDQALATQVNSLLTQMLSLANTQSGDQYLYGGTSSEKPPFVSVPSTTPGGAPQVVYQGSQERASAPVGQSQAVDTLYAGSEIFQAQQRGPTTITGTTGAQPGTGTDSATGQGSLLVAHTSTTYAAGSGVQPGTGSAAGDTIIGPAGAHTLTIDDTSGNGSAGTVSLDGGPPVGFSSADTNLEVKAANGDAVFVNTTAISAGFSGSVAITANGTLSVDGGLSSTPIDFSSNQVVTNSTTGAVTNVNSTQIRQAGTDQVNYPGTEDAFQALQTLSEALNNVNGLNSSQQEAAIQNSLTELNRLQNNVLNVVGEQSASLQNLQSLGTQISSVQEQTKEFVTNTQGADVPSVTVNLQSQENLMQLTLSATAQLFNLNLLNYL
jgi:flagellar hook-associated protein 3